MPSSSASLRVEAGGRLFFEGSNPARVYARGSIEIEAGAVLDLSGTTPAPHDSARPEPDADWLVFDGLLTSPNSHDVEPLERPRGGPGAGDGGWGADRIDYDRYLGEVVGETTGLPDLRAVGALAQQVFVNGWQLQDSNGKVGIGVGRGIEGGGTGGRRWPDAFPTHINTVEAGGLFTEDLLFTKVASIVLNPPDGAEGCFARQVGGVGAGGAYSLPGGAGQAVANEDDSFQPAGNNNPDFSEICDGIPDTGEPYAYTCGATPPAAFDPSSSSYEPPSFINADYAARTLAFSAEGPFDPPNYLRGGSGGGGGGAHPFDTYAGGLQQGLIDCVALESAIENYNGIDGFRDHSGAAGGGGGGALQLVSGVTIEVAGFVDASGGNGGSATTFSPSRGFFAMPGGGGSGGVVRLQAREVALVGEGAHIDVRGGQGGMGVWSNSYGGNGSPGAVRIETSSDSGLPGADANGADHDLFDHAIVPFGEASLGEHSVNILSVAPGYWGAQDRVPDAMAGSVSCWIRPTGNFYSLNLGRRPRAYGQRRPGGSGLEHARHLRARLGAARRGSALAVPRRERIDGLDPRCRAFV